LGLSSNPLLAKLCWGHFELGFNALEGEVVQLLVELFKKLCVSLEAIELSELNLKSSEKGLLRPVTPRS
jgi:hypothetical protein